MPARQPRSAAPAVTSRPRCSLYLPDQGQVSSLWWPIPQRDGSRTASTLSLADGWVQDGTRDGERGGQGKTEDVMWSASTCVRMKVTLHAFLEICFRPQHSLLSRHDRSLASLPQPDGRWQHQRRFVTPGTWLSARCHKPARPGTLGADLLTDRAH